MRLDTTLVQVAMCLASWSSVTAAWPDSVPNPNDALVVRQDDNNDNRRTSASPDDEASKTDEDKPPARTTSDGPKETGKNGDKDEEGDKKEEDDKDKSKDDNKKTSSSRPTPTRFPPDAPPGGVTMLEPVTTFQPTPLYKIGEKVTFNWTYTSLRGPPSGIDILASCSFASNTWTLTSNMTFTKEVKYVWDTNEQATDVAEPLLDQLYTLIVKDSASEVTDVPDPGYLAPYSGLTFGLYTPAAPTPWDKWKCTGCSAGTSLIDRQALGLAVTMSLISILSFTWFVTGLGLH